MREKYSSNPEPYLPLHSERKYPEPSSLQITCTDCSVHQSLLNSTAVADYPFALQRCSNTGLHCLRTNRLATVMQLPRTLRFLGIWPNSQKYKQFLSILNSYYFVCNLKLWCLNINQMIAPGVVFILAFVSLWLKGTDSRALNSKEGCLQLIVCLEISSDSTHMAHAPVTDLPQGPLSSR